MNALPDCAKDVGAITGLPGTAAAGKHVTAQDISTAAANVSFTSSLSSDQIETQYAGVFAPANWYFANNPRVHATAPLNSNKQYWRVGVTLGWSQPFTEGSVMHELLHNLGFTDQDIQSSLGLTVDSNNTDNISDKLATDCFPFIL